jgi:hypothetical protein
MKLLGTRSDADTQAVVDSAWAAPDYAEPISAWRAWCVVDEPRGPMLRSIFFPDLWEPRRPLLAACHHRRLVPFRRRAVHDAPAKRCECGIYGADAETAAKYLNVPVSAEIARVFGLVSLWGSVLECARGWRGTRAYPAAVYVPTNGRRNRCRWSPGELARLLGRYGVGVEVLDCSEEEVVAAAQRRAAAQKGGTR